MGTNGRICSKCNEFKTYDKLVKDSRTIDGYRNTCKDCRNKSNSIYFKTEKGLISSIYRNQKKYSKRRGHLIPAYSLKELTIWLYNNNYKEMYSYWVNNDFKKDLKPSIDRRKNNLGYSFNNIRLVTFKENIDYYNQDVKNGVNSSKLKPVYCCLLSSKTLFPSIALASKYTGVRSSGIIRCCKGQRKTAGGYKWVYK